MPLCIPSMKDAAAKLACPKRASEVPLLGRTDWWSLWYQALGFNEVPALKSIGATLTVEYLDIQQALAGDGVAIGSPILFKAEIDAGRLVPAHDLVATDGRAFWFTVPVVREDSRKISQFRDWIQGEAAAACDFAAEFIGRAKAG